MQLTVPVSKIFEVLAEVNGELTDIRLETPDFDNRFNAIAILNYTNISIDFIINHELFKSVRITNLESIEYVKEYDVVPAPEYKPTYFSYLKIITKEEI